MGNCQSPEQGVAGTMTGWETVRRSRRQGGRGAPYSGPAVGTVSMNSQEGTLLGYGKESAHPASMVETGHLADTRHLQKDLSP